MTEPITDAEIVEDPGTSLAVQQQTPTTIFKTDDPMEIMQRTSEVASALKEFIGKQGLVSKISGRDYIVVEGWQMLGMMLGVTPGKVTTTPIADGWQSQVELHDRTGRSVGMGEAECLSTEKTWKSRDDYARRSMAQTRAIAKAYRNTFGFIAKAAGFEATPAEEMPQEHAQPQPVPQANGAESPRLTKAQLERTLAAIDAKNPAPEYLGLILGKVGVESPDELTVAHAKQIATLL